MYQSIPGTEDDETVLPLAGTRVYPEYKHKYALRKAMWFKSYRRKLKERTNGTKRRAYGEL